MALLDICISTLNEGIWRAAQILDQSLAETSYTIVHQITDGKSYEEFYRNYPHVQFIKLNEKGLSHSRNAAIKASEAEWIYLCDDDLQIEGNIVPILRRAEQLFPSADIYSFQILTSNGQPYKHYPQTEKMLSMNGLGAISSAEMVVNRRALDKQIVHFNERFGLGSEFISGEEYLMLRNLKQSGGKVVYIPSVIAMHPEEGTGLRFTTKLVASKGAIMAATYGHMYIILNLLYACKKFPVYRKQISFLSFLKYIYLGSKAYFKHA